MPAAHFEVFYIFLLQMLMGIKEHRIKKNESKYFLNIFEDPSVFHRVQEKSSYQIDSSNSILDAPEALQFTRECTTPSLGSAFGVLL